METLQRVTTIKAAVNVINDNKKTEHQSEAVHLDVRLLKRTGLDVLRKQDSFVL